MSSTKREKDRHVSGTGRRDYEKKGGHGGWGKLGEEDGDYILDKGDPNYQSSDEEEDTPKESTTTKGGSS